MDIFTEAFITLIILCSSIVVPATELLKKVFAKIGQFAVFVSLIISAIIAWVIGTANHLAFFNIIVLAVITWAVANGWYKVAHKPTNP